ncbi:deoxyribose-phosphate aldolase [Azospirillum sp. INR13]|uniref:deoxyribose-phosphate aldolase n=1 Tax=Azospirillum sp. INR13 TaxID=2596919 RepID=UPI00351C18F3
MVRHGAREVDMVIPIGLLKAGRTSEVRDDIAAVKRACGDALLKVIIETCLLTDDEKILACRCRRRPGPISSRPPPAFAGGGATVEDVALMRRTVGDEMGVKASGGVRTTEDARRMIAAGASRIGASASVAIVGG